MGQRFQTKQLVSFLGKMPLFSGCDPDELTAVVERCEQVGFQRKSALMIPGKPVSGLGVLLQGRAALMSVDVSGTSQKRLEKLAPGSFFGELGLLLGTANPLSAVAEEDCVALFVKSQFMEQLFPKRPGSCLALAKKVSSRFVQLSLIAGKGNGSSSPQKAEDPPANDIRRPGEIPWVDLSNYSLTREILQMVPVQMMRDQRILPLAMTDRTLTVGFVNPKSVQARQQLRSVLHSADPEIVAISADDFNDAVVRLKLASGQAQVDGRSKSRKNLPVTYKVDTDKEADSAHLYIAGPHCATDGTVAPALLENLVERGVVSQAGATKMARPLGCDACKSTGYLGRVAVQEVMSFNDALRSAVAKEAHPGELIELAKKHKRFFSFAQSASFLMARRLIAPSDALLLLTD